MTECTDEVEAFKAGMLFCQSDEIDAKLAAGIAALDAHRAGHAKTNAAVSQALRGFDDVCAERDALREALDWCVAEINRESPAALNGRKVLAQPKDQP